MWGDKEEGTMRGLKENYKENDTFDGRSEVMWTRPQDKKGREKTLSHTCGVQASTQGMVET